jgi:hypothetical protein
VTEQEAGSVLSAATLDPPKSPAHGSALAALDDLAAVFALHADELVRDLVAAGYPDASDAVQEAFAQAVVHWRRIRRYDEPLVWLRRVAINKARNRSRSRRRQLALQHRLEQSAALVAAGQDTPRDDVIAAVEALPPSNERPSRSSTTPSFPSCRSQASWASAKAPSNLTFMRLVPTSVASWT